MEVRKPCYLVAVVIMLLAVSVQTAYAKGISVGQLQLLHKDRHLLGIDCVAECERRCSAAGNKKRCIKYCGICCSKCQCVPPGTFGNKDACPCYRDLKNGKQSSKCP